MYVKTGNRKVVKIHNQLVRLAVAKKLDDFAFKIDRLHEILNNERG